MATSMRPTLSESEWIELIRTHYSLQRGAFVTEFEQGEDWVRVFSEVSPVPMWNHIAWLGQNPSPSSALLRELQSSWPRPNRRPVIYILEPRQATGAVESELRQTGFEKCDQESWMFHSLSELPPLERMEGLQVRLALNEPEISDFVRVFSAAYQAKGDQYEKVFRQAQGQATSDRRVDHYVLYAEGSAVCTATMASQNGRTGIYDVGTLPQARKRGYAAQLLVWLIAEALARGCQHLFLQAERNSAAERLYARLGFRTAFARTGYRLIHWSLPASASVHQSSVDRRVEDGQFLAAAHQGEQLPRRAAEYATESLLCPSGLLEKVGAFAERSGLNPTVPWVAAWSILLSRYSQKAEVGFRLRLPRAHGDGDWHTRPIWVGVREEGQVVDWLRELETLLSSPPGSSLPDLAAQDHETHPLDTLVDLGSASGGTFQPPTGSTFTWRLLSSGTGGLEVIYDRSRFDLSSVRRIADHLLTLVSGLVSPTSGKVGALEMLTATERHQLLVEWNWSGQIASEARLVHQLFADQAGRTPEGLALTMAAERAATNQSIHLSYGELDRRANQLAHHLVRLGLRSEQIVALCPERSTDMIVALIAVLKAGGVCLPLDPALPAERLSFILSDARADVVLGHERTLRSLPAHSARAVALDGETEVISREPSTAPACTCVPHAPAYIIYTSGSTGQPKGVVVPQRALARHCIDAAQGYGLGPQDRVLQFNSISFDAAFEQIFASLISGAALVLRGPEIWTAKELAQHLENHAVTVADLPTPYWHQVLHEWDRSALPRRLPRLFIVGGEAMVPSSLRLWRQLGLDQVRLINAYGPTEATITATSFEITAEFLTHLPTRIPIGRPRGERTAYVLDPHKRLTPLGLPGELHLGGPLLATGYLHRPELTTQKFMPDPFSGRTGDRLYRTGDLVRYLPDGNLEFLGRVDQQVKIRGFRVELGEIEATLASHPHLRETAVTLREEGGRSYLAAYVIPRNGHCPSPQELRQFLGQRLPEYMVPAQFMRLERLPLLPGGKIDRRSLPAPPTDAPASSVAGPRDALELRLRLLFERILQRQGIGIDASFFELGGDSLQALELIVEIERMSGRSLPLGTLYQSSSVESLAKLLQADPSSSDWSSLVPLQTGGARPPLFLVHTTPGDILGYGNLIYHLDPEQPCYGLQSLGLFRPDLSHNRIEEMAAYYVSLIRSLQPEGPYYLAGWCYGGIVAVEMAQQFHQLGEQVAFLGLLETIAPAPGFRNYPYYLHRLGCLLRMNPRQWLHYFHGKLRYYREVRRANKLRFRRLEKREPDMAALVEEHNRKLDKLERVYNTNLVALSSYRLRPYRGQVTLFNAEIVDPGIIADPLYAWPGLAAEIDVHVVPGDHDTMLMEPNVAVLASKLEDALRRAQADAAGHSQPLQPANFVCGS